MSFWSQLSKENRQTLVLALPMMAGQIGQMMMGWADTIMVGHVGMMPLAACAFALTIFHPCLVFGFGMISSVSIRVSQAFGARQYRETGELLLSGTVLGVLWGVILASVLTLGWPLLYHLGQEQEVVDQGRGFLMLLAWSSVPMLITTVGKDFSEALSRPWAPFWIIMAGVGANIFLNWLFIFGNWGFPQLGLVGAGWGTLLARWGVAIGLYAYLFLRKEYRPYIATRIALATLKSHLIALVKLGWPSAMHLIGEVGLFATASLMMGWIGVTALAAHQVAITCAATTFMLPLGLAFAVTVRVGQCVGAREPERIRPIAAGALVMTLGAMFVCAAFFLTAGGWVAGLIVADPAVIRLATMLLVVAGFFQICDGFQIVGMGALRGLADVRVPMWFVYASYWGIGLPVCYSLAFLFKWGAVGIWIGLATGLGVASVAILSRLWILSGRDIKPVTEMSPAERR